MSDVENYFNLKARQWVDDAYRDDTGLIPLGMQRINQVCDILNKQYPAASLTICDLGCGGGDLCRKLSELGHSVTGVDRSAGMLSISRSDNNKHSVNFVECAIEDSADHLPSHRYDVVTCMGVMYYLDDEDVFFQVAKKLLKPGGRLILTCRNRLFNFFPGSKKTYEEVDAEDLKSIIQEINSLNQPIETESLQNSLELMGRYSADVVLNSLPIIGVEQQSKTSRLVADIVEGRQHTPQQIKDTASGHGYTVDGFYGVQPHFMLAGNADVRANQIFKKMSEALLPLSAHPASLLWSSHFMVDLFCE